MKWYYNILFFLSMAIIGCQTPVDETHEFIRLEKELADIAYANDKVNYVNPYAQFGGEYQERLAPQTDSLLAIADTYYRLITQPQQTDYSAEFQKIRQLVERRKSKYLQQRWANSGLDTFLPTKAELDTEFRKHALRPKLSRVLAFFNTACINSGMYSIMELHRYLSYQRQGDTIRGEYGLGYIVTDNLIAQLQLTHNNKTITPQTYMANYQKTEATYIPKDTGTYILNGYVTLQDPITGYRYTKQEQRTIYVKP